MYSLTESWFGGMLTTPYTMFGSAVFFDPVTHPDADYEFNEAHSYRCDRGMWTCKRFPGGLSRNAKLGQAMRAVDRMLREALGFEHPLKEQKSVPKYLMGFISDEIEAWTSWRSAHAPRHIDIDLSRLSSIRDAAAITREALLIEEEREGTGALLDAADGTTASAAVPTLEMGNSTTDERMTKQPAPVTTPEEGSGRAFAPTEDPTPEPIAGAGPTNGLSPAAAAYLRALVEGDEGAADAVIKRASVSEDILVDTINEALFELVGDTVVEYGPNGPELIDDYREDVEGFLNHE